MKENFFVFTITNVVITLLLALLCIAVPIYTAIEVPIFWYVMLIAWIILDLLCLKECRENK